MIIQDIITQVNLLTNRKQSRYYSPTEIMTAINSSVLDMFNESRSEFEETQKVNDLLRVFKATETISLTSGVGNLASDYASITGFNDNIDLVGDDRWGEVQNDVICSPDADYPVANILGSTIRVLPTSITSVDITYLKTPVNGVYATTLSSNSRDYIFDEGNSTDVEIPEHKSPELLAKTCKYLGIGLSQSDLTQFELLKNQTDK
jgi:hypothetical protein